MIATLNTNSRDNECYPQQPPECCSDERRLPPGMSSGSSGKSRYDNDVIDIQTIFNFTQNTDIFIENENQEKLGEPYIKVIVQIPGKPGYIGGEAANSPLWLCYQCGYGSRCTDQDYEMFGQYFRRYSYVVVKKHGELNPENYFYYGPSNYYDWAFPASGGVPTNDGVIKVYLNEL